VAKARRPRGLLLAGTLAGAVAVGATVAYIAFAGSTGSSADPSLVAALAHHQLMPSECNPVRGSVWVYPGPEKVSSDLYESFATDYSCQEAAMWTRQLVVATVAVSPVGDPTTLAGPAGFTCNAWPDAKGHAYAGACRRGTTAAEFGWNWNVVNRRVALVPDINDAGTHLDQQLGTDALSILTSLGADRYRLVVENTSSIGSIDGFTWSPPAGWTVTAVTRNTGAGTCSVASDGRIACKGSLRAPACLCTPSGGKLVVQFTAHGVTHSKGPVHAMTFGTGGARVHITAMTPVPFLIPDTPQEVARQPGL
jgi:hypothetical protein